MTGKSRIGRWLGALLPACLAALVGTTAYAQEEVFTCMNMRADHAAAVAACNRALAAATPETIAQLHHFRGSHLMIGRDFDGAIADFNQVLARKPDNAAALANRGRCWYEKGDFDKALADFNAALAINPTQMPTLADRARVWLKKADGGRALVDVNEALRVSPGNASLYQLRSAARRLNRDLDGAIADADEAIRLQPRFALAYHSRSLALQHKGDRERALQDIEVAIRLDPGQAMHQAQRDRLLGVSNPAPSPRAATTIPSDAPDTLEAGPRL